MTIALIAHDAKKELMIQFCIAYCGVLSRHKLCATGTTGKLVSEATGLEIPPLRCPQCSGCNQYCNSRSVNYGIGTWRSGLAGIRQPAHLTSVPNDSVLFCNQKGTIFSIIGGYLWHSKSHVRKGRKTLHQRIFPMVYRGTGCTGHRKVFRLP